MTDDFDSPRPPIGVSDQLRDEIAQIKTVKTDADIAAELREEITPHMNALCKVMEKSLTHGMQISFAMNPDAFGRYIPPFINITKAL